MEKNKISFRDYVESYNRTVEKEINRISVLGYIFGGIFIWIGFYHQSQMFMNDSSIVLTMFVVGAIFIALTFVIQRFKSRILSIIWGIYITAISLYLLMMDLLGMQGLISLLVHGLFLCYGVAYIAVFHNAHKQYKRYLIATATTSNPPAYDKK